jgi:hypothetical protein
MKLILDLDSYVYAAAFVAQTTVRFIRPKGFHETMASFNSAKDRDEWFKGMGYTKRGSWKEDFDEVTTVEADPPQRALDAFQTMLDEVYDLWTPDTAIAYRSDRKESFRERLFPEYKQNRQNLIKPVHYWVVEEAAEKMSLVKKGLEADDCVIMEAFGCEEPWVIAGVDKDLRQIPGTFWDPVKKIKAEVSREDATRNFWTQVLTGDRSDNIPGLVGVGPKTAESILEGCQWEPEFRQAALEAYRSHGQNAETMDRNCTLLYLLRFEGDRWEGGLKF